MTFLNFNERWKLKQKYFLWRMSESFYCEYYCNVFLGHFLILSWNSKTILITVDLNNTYNINDFCATDFNLHGDTGSFYNPQARHLNYSHFLWWKLAGCYILFLCSWEFSSYPMELPISKFCVLKLIQILVTQWFKFKIYMNKLIFCGN